MRVWERDCVSLCKFVLEYCVFEVRGGVAVCREVWVTAGGGSVWADCQLLLFNPPSLSLFLTFFLYLPPFPSLFSLFSSCFHSHIHRLAQCTSSPSIFSLSSRTGQTGKHTSPQQQQTVKEVWKRERGQRRKGAPVSKCSTSSGDSTWGTSRSVCLFYAPFTRGSMYTDTQEPSCSAGVFLMQINISC